MPFLLLLLPLLLLVLMVLHIYFFCSFRTGVVGSFSRHQKSVPRPLSETLLVHGLKEASSGAADEKKTEVEGFEEGGRRVREVAAVCSCVSNTAKYTFSSDPKNTHGGF